MLVTRVQGKIVLQNQGRDPDIISRDRSALYAELSKNRRIRDAWSDHATHDMINRNCKTRFWHEAWLLREEQSLAKSRETMYPY